MNKNKPFFSLGLILLLLMVNCSFAKPKNRSRPVLQEKARVEKTKLRLQDRKLEPVPPQMEDDLINERDRRPENNKPKTPDKIDKLGKRKPAFPVFNPKSGKLKESNTPEQNKKPIEKRPKRPTERPKPPVIRPTPPPERPKPPAVRPTPPHERPKPPAVRPTPPPVRPTPPHEKPKPPRFSQPERFPSHFRGAPGSHQWNNHYDHRPVRRYRGSSFFYPHFPRYYYDSWILVQENTTYTRVQLPEQMRIQVACGNYVEFELEENPDTAYQWMASYDAWYSRIDIIHPPKEDKSLLQFLFSKPGKATIQIEALNPGTTMVELICIRPWEFERGDNPAKRIQLYLDIAPE